MPGWRATFGGAPRFAWFVVVWSTAQLGVQITALLMAVIIVDAFGACAGLLMRRESKGARGGDLHAVARRFASLEAEFCKRALPFSVFMHGMFNAASSAGDAVMHIF